MLLFSMTLLALSEFVVLYAFGLGNSRLYARGAGRRVWRGALQTMGNIERMQSTRSANRALARLIFFTFLLTFVAARVLVFLIMSHKLPDLFLHVGGTHVHHLNYGIFLLCGVGAYLLFAHPTKRRWRTAAVVYAIGLALTFDEFGMWLHLGGGYWQRASYDAIAVIIGILGFFAYFPSQASLRQKYWWQTVIVIVVCIAFFVMLADSFQYASKKFDSRMEQIEERGAK